MAKRLGMGQKKKRPEDLTELERFLQLNRQVGTVPIAEVETDPYGSVVRGPGSRQRAILIEEPPLPRIDHDPIVSGPSRRGEPAVPEEAYPGPISGLLPEVSQADIHDQMIEEWTPYKEATRQMAVDEEAREEAARVAAEEKAYTEGRIYVVDHTLGQQKTMHSMDAPRLWKKGEYDAVVDYCLKDSQLVYDLWKHGQEKGTVKAFNINKEEQIEMEVNW